MTLDTAAIQKALDDCGKTGGTVLLSGGVFKTGTLWLRSRVNLRIDADATLLGSDNLADYNAPDAYPQNWYCPEEGWSARHLVIAHEVEDVAITGGGAIDGNADAFFSDKPAFTGRVCWRDGAHNAKDAKACARPGQELVFVESRGIRLEGVTLRNMACWTCFFHGCDGVDVRSVKVRNNVRYLNTDAFDIDCTRNVVITGCDIETGDDAFAVRANPEKLKNRDRVSENVRISNCTCRVSADAVRVGVGTGRVRDVRVSGLDVKGCGVGLHVQSSYSETSRGVDISDVAFEDVVLANAGISVLVTGGTSGSRAVIEGVDFHRVTGHALFTNEVRSAGTTVPKRITFRACDFSAENEPCVVFAPDAVEVVVAPKAPKTVRFACDELTNFLSRVLSCDIPVVTEPTGRRNAVVLGEEGEKVKVRGEGEQWNGRAVVEKVKVEGGGGQWNGKSLEPRNLGTQKPRNAETRNLARDGFVIRAETNRVFICGADDPLVDPAFRIRQGSVGATYEIGTLFGVYEFLERYAGCRFFFPGDIGTVVPRAERVSVPVGEWRVEPRFTSRSVYLNGCGKWYEGEEKRVEGRGVEGSERSERALAWIRWRLETYPIPCCHGQNKFQITERFAQTHPEYFALRKDGTRYTVVPPGAPEDWRVKQLCHTSGVWEEMYRDTASYLKGEDASVRGMPSRRKPGAFEWGVNCFDRKYVDIMPQDGMVECQCANCQAAYAAYQGPRNRAASDLIWRHTAELAKRLKEEKIPGTVTMMAYEQYLDVPKFELPDNILVVVAQFGPWSMRDAKKTAGEMEMFRRWHEKTGRKVRTWTYPCKWHATDIKGVPCMTPRAVGRYYQMAAPDIIGGFAETDCDRAIFQYLNSYVYAKVAWDPDLDVDALLKDHHEKMFGKGAPWMEKFYDELEDAWLGQVVGNVVETPVGPQASAPDEFALWGRIYSPEALKRWRGYFDAAYRAVPAASDEAKRLAFIDRQLLGCLEERSEAHRNMTDLARGLASRRAPSGTSIVTNGTFESSLAGWRVGGKGGRAVLDDEVRMTGKKSVRLTATGEARVDLRFDFGAAMKPDTEYRLSYFMKTKDVAITSPGGGVYPEIWDGRYKWFADLHAGEGSLDWTYCEKTFRSAVKFDEKFPPFLHFFINGAGTVWFDDVRLEEVAATADFQAQIDALAAKGGGTLVIGPGVHRSGALFFKPGVNLHLEKGAVLLGSDEAADYPQRETRIEGKTRVYYPALVNADRCDGFRISGEGTIDGHGFPTWKAFWPLYRADSRHPQVNTREELVRPRVLYVSNSKDVDIGGVTFKNAKFWTTHYYRCKDVLVHDCKIVSEEVDGTRGPSTDAIDIDACQGFVVSNVVMDVFDDAVVVKGGKGVFANDYSRHPENGISSDVLVTHCTFSSQCAACLTVGSECPGCRNVKMVDCRADGARILLHLKMRVDTPQLYEDVVVEGCTGGVGTYFLADAWSQMSELAPGQEAPPSVARRITMRNNRVAYEKFDTLSDKPFVRYEELSIR